MAKIPSDFIKPQRVTLFEQILEQMEDCIRQQVWQVGEKIPTESELVEEFGVSRNTIREAVQALVFAGVLQARPGDGTYILSSTQLDAALRKRFRAAQLAEVLETRLVLEKEIVRLAAMHCTKPAAAALHELLIKRSDTQLNIDDFLAADYNFHLYIASMIHNRILYDLYATLMNVIDEIDHNWLINAPDNRQPDEHQALYDAITAGDADQGEAAVRSLLISELQNLMDAGVIETSESWRLKVFETY